ncbi:putative O-linked N-acetylglucosamine transferase (SPINDLY family) [Azospirillum agricola]|uniref:tetratricopeptide repeat protein n=1 Tax=Azospirillum agricola TaxID=1720247 RepID=UPI001AE9EA7B|nr:tetratricopeptide repeat protein [Azospirillum agricola]MBP2230512.1 putative O-linked N-acetylglucosamine transferase (SPINDLY family) [Azospirillum agricola]
MATIAEALAIAFDHHQTGRYDEAELLYRRILDADPEQAQALHLCGLLVAQLGRLEEADGLLTRAAAAAPLAADPRVNHGKVLRALGRPGEAVRRFRHAVALNPALVEAQDGLGHAERERGDPAASARGFGRAAVSGGGAAIFYHWGLALETAGQPGAAVSALRRSAELDPEAGAVPARLGTLLHGMGRTEDAAPWYRRALTLRPAHNEVLHNLAVIARGAGRHDEAVRGFSAAARLHPDREDARRDLFAALLDLGRARNAARQPEAALDAYEQALAIDPMDVAVADALALTLFELGRFEDARRAYRRVVVLDPAAFAAHYNGALASKNLGAIAEAMTGLRAATRLSDEPWVHSTRLTTLLLLADLDNATLADEIDGWRNRFGRTLSSPVAPNPALTRPALGGRPLRVGYVSGYLHPGNRLLDQVGPLLRAHDRSRVVPLVYGNLPFAAPAFDRLRGFADGWCDTRAMSDDELADRVRADGVDVLVCLIGHTSGQRMGLFTRRAAPLQVSYYGMHATGVDAMDVWLTDPVLHPADSTERFTERLVRLPHLFLFEPPARRGAGWLPAPPCATLGRVTFGSFNLDAKVNQRVVALWSALLHAVPGSRLMLKSRGAGLAGEEGRVRMAAAFARHDIGGDRLLLVPPAASHEEHLRLHERVDIALDPFPYGGCLTSFDALSMGVPVVTLAGERFIGRMTASLLHSLGEPGWVAHSEEDYIAKAKSLAEDPHRLAAIRMVLREKMTTSPLCDATSHAQSIEAVFCMV